MLFEDEHLLALDKPAGLLTSPDRQDAKLPSLIQLLQQGIERGVPWVKDRNLTYLMHTHRLEAETSGVLLFAKDKPTLLSLATQFGSEKPNRIFVALVRGVAALEQSEFRTDAKIAPNRLQMGLMRVDTRNGKRSKTEFTVRERFDGYMLMECRPLTARNHQLRLHLKHVGFKLVADQFYGGPPLLLSSLKDEYRLKRGRTERPLIGRTAIHAEQVVITHPVTGAELKISAPWPKDFEVSVKYLRRYASKAPAAGIEPATPEEI